MSPLTHRAVCLGLSKSGAPPDRLQGGWRAELQLVPRWVPLPLRCPQDWKGRDRAGCAARPYKGRPGRNTRSVSHYSEGISCSGVQRECVLSNCLMLTRFSLVSGFSHLGRKSAASIRRNSPSLSSTLHILCSRAEGEDWW